MSGWAIAIIVVLVIGIVLFSDPDRKAKEKLRRLLAGRKKSSNQLYHESFFLDSDVSIDVISKIRQIFCEQIGEDLEALEPDDDLAGDYSVIWQLDSLADVEIVIALEEEFDITISNAEAEAMKSIRDIAETVTAKLVQRSNANP